MRRFAAMVVIVTGLVLVAAPFALRLFERTSDAEQVMDRFRPMMTDEGLAQLSADFQTVKAGGTQFTDEAMPRFANDLGMTDAEFQSFVNENFPHVATGVESIPPVVSFVEPVIATLHADAGKFHQADAIPVKSLPLTVGPWAFLGLGVLLVIGGVVALRGGKTLPLVLLLVLGTAMVLGPFLVRFPQKAADGEDVAVVARIGLAPDGAAKAQQATTVLDDMIQEINDAMIPALATQLGVSEARVRRTIATDYPATAALLQQWPDILPRGRLLADNQTASVDDFAAADELPFTTLPWIFIVAGAVTALAATGALWRGRRKNEVDPAADEREPTVVDEPLVPAGAGARERE